MPPSTTFLYFYPVTGTFPNLMTIGTREFGPYTVIDDRDGNQNGDVSVGDTFTYQPTVSIQFEGTLLGFTPSGDPVFMFDLNGGTTAVLTDNPTFSGSFTVNTTGSLNVCFGHGTLVATPSGEKEVQNLEIGDLIETDAGQFVSVKWIGRQSVRKFFSGSKSQPVRILAGALGNGLPHSDLTVTADHGIVLNGYVINASALVNGDTIDFVPMHELEDIFTVYHVETENHDVILANGAPSETFVDATTRSRFDNYEDYLTLYGTERIIPEMDRPRITSHRLLPQSVLQMIEPNLIGGFERRSA